MSTRHLVIMAAGTGGHIIPGLAVAEEMKRRGWSISWVGTETGMENKLVPPTGIPMDRLAFSGLRGKGLKHAVTGLYKLVQAFVQSRMVYVTRDADAVLGMGGYVCVPGGVMAWLMRKPLLLVNADAALLMSNKFLQPFAQRLAFGFEGEAASGSPKRVVTGNPVRAAIEALPSPAERFAGRSGPLRVLVVGGSLGAKAINEAMPEALRAMAPALRPQVVHQTGQGQHAQVLAAYKAAGVEADVRPFIDDMAEQLAQCDVILCRAGAVTVSELCAAGVPAILVPLVVSTTSHQRDNAEHMARRDAAIHLPQSQLSPQRLQQFFSDLKRERLLQLAENARALARPQAASRVADEIEQLVQARHER